MSKNVMVITQFVDSKPLLYQFSLNLNVNQFKQRNT